MKLEKVTFQVRGADVFHECAEAAYHYAMEHEVDVSFKFNGVLIEITRPK